MLNIYPEWQGLPIIPSKAAMNELYKFGLTLDDIKGILEEGYEGKKRKTGTVEKCKKKDDKIIKVVVTRSFNYSFKTECWVLVHIGFVKW